MRLSSRVFQSRHICSAAQIMTHTVPTIVTA
jgi:hypothetical protein